MFRLLSSSTSKPCLNRRQVMLGLGSVSITALFAPALIAGDMPDMAAYDRLLATYVIKGADGLNRVDYGGLRKNDLGALREFVAAMERLDVPGMPTEDQIAYWINLYNAKTLEIVAENYPVQSIKQINLGGGVFGRGPWKAKILSVLGRKYSLDDIEHRVLRKRYSDPRIHYALNCASIGCPNLQIVGWRGETLAAQFDSGARAYINHRRGLDINASNFTASKIYKWYAKDFGGMGGLKRHWATYAESELTTKLADAGRPDRYVYDWSLNDKL